MDNEWSHLPEHVIAVIPHAVEAQNFAVQFKKLLLFVEGRRCGVGAQGGGILAALNVRVGRQVLTGVDLQAFTLEEILDSNVSNFRFNFIKILCIKCFMN